MKDEEATQDVNHFARLGQLGGIASHAKMANAKMASIRAMPQAIGSPINEMCLLERVSVLENQLAETQGKLFDMIHELNIRIGNLETIVRG